MLRWLLLFGIFYASFFHTISTKEIHCWEGPKGNVYQEKGCKSCTNVSHARPDIQPHFRCFLEKCTKHMIPEWKIGCVHGTHENFGSATMCCCEEELCNYNYNKGGSGGNLQETTTGNLQCWTGSKSREGSEKKLEKKSGCKSCHNITADLGTKTYLKTWRCSAEPCLGKFSDGRRWTKKEPCLPGNHSGVECCCEENLCNGGKGKNGNGGRRILLMVVSSAILGIFFLER